MCNRSTSSVGLTWRRSLSVAVAALFAFGCSGHALLAAGVKTDATNQRQSDGPKTVASGSDQAPDVSDTGSQSQVSNREWYQWHTDWILQSVGQCRNGKKLVIYRRWGERVTWDRFWGWRRQPFWQEYRTFVPCDVNVPRVVPGLPGNSVFPTIPGFNTN